MREKIVLKNSILNEPEHKGDLPSDGKLEGSRWNYPEKLSLKKGLVYELVGRIVYQQESSHFISKFRIGHQKTIYEHDGFSDGLIKPISQSSIQTDLAGLRKENTCLALYVLKNYSEIVHESRTKILEREMHLQAHIKDAKGKKRFEINIRQYNDANFEPMKQEERVWGENEMLGKTLEYELEKSSNAPDKFYGKNYTSMYLTRLLSSRLKSESPISIALTEEENDNSEETHSSIIPKIVSGLSYCIHLLI